MRTFGESSGVTFEVHVHHGHRRRRLRCHLPFLLLLLRLPLLFYTCTVAVDIITILSIRIATLESQHHSQTPSPNQCLPHRIELIPLPKSSHYMIPRITMLRHLLHPQWLILLIAIILLSNTIISQQCQSRQHILRKRIGLTLLKTYNIRIVMRQYVNDTFDTFLPWMWMGRCGGGCEFGHRGGNVVGGGRVGGEGDLLYFAFLVLGFVEGLGEYVP
mmetsp:Transcript_18916/g.41201  ORF Transcript_18916/g.41201 Transcript_18916/m.41201 type:complete len:217 (+) Transcript_18916:1607-2257(+)